MWGGVCHSVAYEDARTLVRAGMAEPSRRQAGSFDGLVFATSEYRTPGEALAIIARSSGGRLALSAAAGRPKSFLPTAARKPQARTSSRRRSARAG